ncbi:hypothetical protein GCM10027262_61630 [Nocardia tengchongensis]
MVQSRLRDDDPAEIMQQTGHRESWALALCTELYRNPSVLPNSPLAEPIRSDRFTTEALLALAPGDALTEMRSLYLLALTELAEFLPDPTAALAPGPTFAASQLCSADADLIVDGVLISSAAKPITNHPAPHAEPRRHPGATPYPPEIRRILR